MTVDDLTCLLHQNATTHGTGHPRTKVASLDAVPAAVPGIVADAPAGVGLRPWLPRLPCARFLRPDRLGKGGACRQSPEKAPRRIDSPPSPCRRPSASISPATPSSPCRNCSTGPTKSSSTCWAKASASCFKPRRRSPGGIWTFFWPTRRWSGRLSGLVTIDRRLLRIFEPRTATPRVRLSQMRQLVAGGVATLARVDPILPGLTDDPDALHGLCAALAEAGVREIAAGTLVLRPALVNALRNRLARPQIFRRLTQAFAQGSSQRFRVSWRPRGSRSARGPAAEDLPVADGHRRSVWHPGTCLRLQEPGPGRPVVQACRSLVAAGGGRAATSAVLFLSRVASSAAKTHQERQKNGGSSLRSTPPYSLRSVRVILLHGTSGT